MAASSVDLLFLVDSSSSVGPAGFDRQLQFASDLVADAFDDQTSFALVNFSGSNNPLFDSVVTQFGFGIHSTVPAYQQDVGSTPFLGGQGWTRTGFAEALTVLGDSPNPTAAKQIIFLTDGDAPFAQQDERIVDADDGFVSPELDFIRTSGITLTTVLIDIDADDFARYIDPLDDGFTNGGSGQILILGDEETYSDVSSQIFLVPAPASAVVLVTAGLSGIRRRRPSQ